MQQVNADKIERTKARQLDYDIAYMKMAIAMSELSYAERKKVGAIIVSTNDQVIAQGYNGMPHGFDNVCEIKDEQCDANLAKYCERKAEHGTCWGCDAALFRTKDEVLHAETNAIMKCASMSGCTDGATLYVTLSPCFDCAKLIIQAKIARVVYLAEYRLVDGIHLLRKAGIAVEQLDAKCLY